MAERKFDYQQVGDVYQSMLKTIGSAGDGESIAGILDGLNKEMDARVNVEDEAIFGSLGAQLSLDWDNTSSNFPGFVSKFSNWATLIAQSGASYSEFENDIKGFKKEDEGTYLGATSGGIHENYIATSAYNQYQAENTQSYLDSLAGMRGLNQLTGATYLTTDSKHALKMHQISTGVVLGMDILGILWTGLAVSGIAGGTVAAGTELAPTNPPQPPTPTSNVPERPMLTSGSDYLANPTGPTTGGGTPLQLGTSTSYTIDDLNSMCSSAMSRAGSDLASKNYINAFSDMINQVKNLGATTAIKSTADPSCYSFYNAAGEWVGNIIGDINGSITLFTPNL